MTPLDRDRLSKILGMLGSGHPGKVSAAGKAANALIRDADATWPEVLGLEGIGAAEQAVRELRAEKEVLQSRLDGCITENAALLDEIERLKAPAAQPRPVAQPKPWSRAVIRRSLGSTALPVIFVCGTVAVWAGLLLNPSSGWLGLSLVCRL